jgi:hypothetical protein
MRRALAIVCSLLWIAVARPALAHHPAYSADALPRSQAALSFELAEFELARSGSWELARLFMEQAFFDRFSIQSELGVARVAFADGETAFGPTDASLGLRVLAYRDDRLAVSLGFGVEIPTGDEERGLGDGHFMATPSAQLSLRPHPAWLFAIRVSDHLPLGGASGMEAPREPGSTTQHGTPRPPGDDDPGPTAAESAAPPFVGSVIAPHGEHELRAAVSATYLWAPLDFRAGPAFTFLLGEDEVLGPLMLESEIGAMANEHLRVSAQVDAPLAGRRRLLWHGRVAVEYLF